MEIDIKEALISKIESARSVVVFLFHPDGTSQAFISGSPHEMMVTMVDEMLKGDLLKSVILGAVEVYKEKHGQIG